MPNLFLGLENLATLEKTHESYFIETLKMTTTGTFFKACRNVTLLYILRFQELINGPEN